MPLKLHLSPDNPMPFLFIPIYIPAMPIRYFYIFLGASLFAIIGLIAYVKNRVASVAAAGTRPIYIAVITAVADALIAFAVTYLVPVEAPFDLYWFFCFLFLLFGMVQFVVAHSMFEQEQNQGQSRWRIFGGELWFSTSVVLLIMILFSAAQYFLKSRDFLFYPVLVSFLVFLVPLLFYHTYEWAVSIPATEFNTWSYPVEKNIQVPRRSSKDNVVRITFQLANNKFSKDKICFKASTPDHVDFRDTFYHFINHNNRRADRTEIHYLDMNSHPITWWFRLKRKWYQLPKVLNPKISIADNGIMDGDLIICEQIS